MKNNILIKLLSSIPTILITLYFIPFLGVCLIILRCFIYQNKKRMSTFLALIAVALLLLVPKGIYFMLNVLDTNTQLLSRLTSLVESKIYTINIINYSKLLITIGVLYIIISYILTTIFNKINNKVTNSIRNYITETEKKNIEISQKNDMEIKIKQEKAKNTTYVKCPNCGSDNLLSDKFGTCNYCRRKLENKNYK